MPDLEAVLSEAPPIDDPHNISPQTPALDTTPPEATLVESPVVPLIYVTTQSILYRPLHSQITIFREGGSGGFRKLHFGGRAVRCGPFYGLKDDLLQNSCQTSYQVHGHVLHKCSFTPFSKKVNELKPFVHCVLLRQALNLPGIKECKLLVQQDRDVTLFRSSQDFHAGSISRRSAEVLDSFKGDFTKLPLLNKS